MIELAKQEDRTKGRCQYVVNAYNDLHNFADSSYDFVYSNITLQHIPPASALRFLREFVRVLRPDGMLLFQLPSHRDASGLLGFVSRLEPIWFRAWRFHPFEVYATPQKRVIAVLEAAGAQVIDVKPDTHAAGWAGFRYAATKSSLLDL